MAESVNKQLQQLIITHAHYVEKYKTFEEIGLAYVENRKKYPDYLLMNHSTMGMIMYNDRLPEYMSKKSLDRDNRTIFGIPVIFDEKLNDNQIKMLYCKKSIN